MSNLLTSRLVNPPHLANIPLILVTLLVSNLLTSKLANSLQSENMELISVTFFVSNLLKSKTVIFSHSINIELIFVTLLVSKFSNPSILTSVPLATLYPIFANKYFESTFAVTPPSCPIVTL